MGNTVYVASISPLKAEIYRPQFLRVDERDINKGGTYRIEPVDRGQPPRVLPIGDAYEMYAAPVTHFPTKNVITAAEIANDLFIHSTQNAPFMSPGCHPGVMIIGDPEVTSEEKADMHRVQSAYATLILQDGNEKANDVKTVKLITAEHRIWAKWLGREPVWLNPPSDLDFMDCPYCRKPTARDAAVCANCHQISNPRRYEELKRAEKEARKLTAA